jgi:hypothetical protein
MSATHLSPQSLSHWPADRQPPVARLTEQDLSAVLDTVAGRPQVPFLQLATQPQRSGFAIRIDCARGPNKPAAAMVGCIVAQAVEPLVMLPLVSEAFGSASEGVFRLSPQGIATVSSLVDGGVPVGLLADPAKCIADVLAAPGKCWQSVDAELRAAGYQINGYAAPVGRSLDAVLATLWIYRSLGRLSDFHPLSELKSLPFYNFEWLFETGLSGSCGFPADCFASFGIAAVDHGQERFVRSLRVCTRLKLRREVRPNVDLMLHSDNDGWVVIDRSGVETSVETAVALGRMRELADEARVAVILDPAHFRPVTSANASKAHCTNDVVVRVLPWPYDYFLAISSDVDWTTYDHFDRTIHRIADELGMRFAGSAYLTCHSPLWPSWDAIESGRPREAGLLRRWASEGFLDTIHGLTFSFEMATLVEKPGEMGGGCILAPIRPLTLDGVYGFLLIADAPTTTTGWPSLIVRTDHGSVPIPGPAEAYVELDREVVLVYRLEKATQSLLRCVEVIAREPDLQLQVMQTLRLSAAPVARLDMLARCNLNPVVFTAHGGGEGADRYGQLWTTYGLSIYPENRRWALDRPGTPLYALPALRNAGIKFYNPLDILFSSELPTIVTLLRPEVAIDGSSYYSFKRYRPDRQLSDRTWSHGKHIATAQALPAVLDELFHRFYWAPTASGAIIYTHLGNRVGNAASLRLGWSEELHAALERLAEYAAGKDKSAPMPYRIWVTTPGAALVYAATIGGLQDHISADAAGIHITSWFDSALGHRIPDPAEFGMGWLHGVTIYLPDGAPARVQVDGVPVKRLTINPPDETGRPSVTIVDDGDCLPLIPDLAEGPLLVEAGKGMVCQVPLDNVPLRNATHWSFNIKVSAGLAWRIILETDNGDRFGAGTRPDNDWPLAAAKDLAAGVCYTLAFDGTVGARQPTGRLVGLRVEIAPGPPSGVLALYEAVVLRPQPARRRSPNHRRLGGRVCLASGGPVAGFEVTLNIDGEIKHAQTDADGWYLFGDLPDGSRADLSINAGVDGAYFVRGRRAVLGGDRLDYDIQLVQRQFSSPHSDRSAVLDTRHRQAGFL